MSTKELILMLKEINNELKEYSKVNQKALDQHLNFSRQRNELIERKNQQDKGEKVTIIKILLKYH